MPHCDEGAVCLDRGTVAVSDFALRTLNLPVVRVGVLKRDHGAAPGAGFRGCYTRECSSSSPLNPSVLIGPTLLSQHLQHPYYKVDNQNAIRSRAPNEVASAKISDLSETTLTKYTYWRSQ